MYETFERFIINNSVKSKLSQTPCVERFENLHIVFIHGFPMTLKGFYTITTKAILGSTFRMNMKTWQDLHHDTRILCEPLKLILHEDREAYSVVQAIKKELNWTKETYDKQRIYKWIQSVEALIQVEKE